MAKTLLRIAFGADHGGFLLKESLRAHLSARSAELMLLDLGTYSQDSVDYPDFAERVAQAILKGESDLGVLCCGTGIGISIAANRFCGIRAALVHNEFTAQMAKAHNNANILCLGGRLTSPELAAELVNIWLATPFEGGRHANRIAKLDH